LKPGLIEVHVSRSIDRLQIVVRNAFQPDSRPEQGNRLALGNIRERLALLYDVEAQLTTSSQDGRFEVRMRFPFVTAST
jgi:two-component system sensor histidine kinase AlgZ